MTVLLGVAVLLVLEYRLLLVYRGEKVVVRGVDHLAVGMTWGPFRLVG